MSTYKFSLFMSRMIRPHQLRTLIYMLTIISLCCLSSLSCDRSTPNKVGGEGAAGETGEEGGREERGREELTNDELWWELDTFEDHTAPRIKLIEDFERLSVMSREMRVVKFWVTEPISRSAQTSEGWTQAAMSRFYDGSFYHLHDEVYWYRLLSGHPVWGYDTTPHSPALNAETIEEMYQRAHQFESATGSLPLGLTFATAGRLYSRLFYDEALSYPRRVILGSVLSIPEREGRIEPDQIWAFELEYSDEPTAQEITSLYTLLRSRLPSTIPELRWLTRSPFQEQLAQELARLERPVGISSLTYRDLIVPGAAEVYSEGVTAGRARYLDDVNALTQERDVLIYSVLPDDLPPCRGVITAIPQTPLAHLNLLARNRGIPNVYLGGIDTNAAVTQLASARAPMLLWTQAPDQWMILPLTADEYQRYINLRNPPSRVIERPSVLETPLWIEWSAQSVSEILSMRPAIGGKSAGVYLINKTLSTSGVDTPDPVLALTGRAYAEHLSPISSVLQQLIDDDDFKRDPHVRALALEGWSGVNARYATGDEQSSVWRASLNTWRDELTTSIRAVIDRGGVQGWIRTQALNTEFITDLTTQLRSTFASLHPRQGLRFRSSSNVEDLEGFNGAGLYTSSTGFLYPRAQSRPADRQRDISGALRETWASYWGVEAFEEREFEGIDHLSGWMGVLVHPRFDDIYEESNGVMTLTLLPSHPEDRGHLSHYDVQLREGSRTAHTFSTHRVSTPIAVATINSQVGAVSVTNPDRPETLTEVIEVKVIGSTSALNQERESELELELELELEINRVQRSTLTDSVLSDTQVHKLVHQALKTTLAWWHEELKSRATAQHPESLTLDFEYRGVSEGWPRLRSVVEQRSPRMIIKQARPLEPAPRGLDQSVWEMPIPLDIIRRAELLERWSCTNDRIRIETTQVFTNKLSTPDLGFSEIPFTSHIRFTDNRPDAWNQGVPYTLTHPQLIIIESSDRQKSESGQWSLRLYRRQGLSIPFQMMTLKEAEGGVVRWIPRLRNGEQESLLHERVTCERQPIYASPSLYLLSIVDDATHNQRGYGSHTQDTP